MAYCGTENRSRGFLVLATRYFFSVACETRRNASKSSASPVRPVNEGTNQLVGAGGDRLEPALDELLAGRAKPGRRPALWDVRAAERIVAELMNG